MQYGGAHSIVTHRPGSYSVDAIGESSEWMVITPSNGRCGSGRTIFASTCASTLHTSGSKRDTGHFSRVACKGTLPCFAQGTFDVAELGAKGKRVRARLEEFAPVEAEGLVEGREEEVFLWD